MKINQDKIDKMVMENQIEIVPFAFMRGRTFPNSFVIVDECQNINLVPTGTGFVNVGNFIISNVASPVASTDAATKQYVDDVAQGLHTHDSCNAATTIASFSVSIILRIFSRSSVSTPPCTKNTLRPFAFSLIILYNILPCFSTI